jgi:hypothetical protein
MFPALVVGVGVAWWLLSRKDRPDETPQDDNGDESPTPGTDEVEEFPDTIEEVWSNDDGLVKVWKIGVHRAGRYDYSFAIGNEFGTSFVRTNSDRGTTTITATDGSRIRRVMVFATRRDAIEYVERPREEPDPNDPTSPQREPEEDDDDSNSPPSLPPQGGLNLGGGVSLTPSFGGM